MAGFLNAAAAQNPIEAGRTPAVDQAGPGGTAAPEASANPKSSVIESLEFKEARLEDVAGYMRAQLELLGMPPNIVLAPGCDYVSPVTLKLRNVKVRDALSLIAAQAGCYLEEISSQEGDGSDIVAFRFVPEEPDPGAEPAPSALPAPPIPSMPTIPPGTETAASATPPATPQDPFRRKVFNVSSVPSRTHIYPLARISMGSGSIEQDLQQLEDVLADLFSRNDIPAHEVKLSFHKGTRILIVQGPETAHEQVDMLLSALRNNNALENSDQHGREIRQLKIELQLREEKQVRLQQQIGELEQQNLVLTRENHLLKLEREGGQDERNGGSHGPASSANQLESKGGAK